MNKGTVLWSVLFTLLWSDGSWPQAQRSVLGNGGLMVIPCAEVMADGTMAAGFSRIPELYAGKLKPYQRSVFYAAMSFLPRLEGTMAIVRPDDYKGGTGDRTVGLKLQLLKQGRKMPSLAIGAQDFFAVRWLDLESHKAQNFACLYAVFSKSAVIQRLGGLTWHIGYGSDAMPAKSHQLTGWFGGVQCRVVPGLHFSVEYDAKKVNVALRSWSLSPIELMLGVWDFSHFCGTINYSFSFSEL